MRFILVIVLLFTFVGVVSAADTRVEGKFEREADPFTNVETIVTERLCHGSILKEHYCFQFLISDNSAFLTIYYTGDDWSFFERARMKVVGVDGFIDIEPFSGDRDVLSGVGVLEALYFNLDGDFYNFAKGAGGKKLLVRLYGGRGYYDFELDTSVGNVWSDFIKYYEEFVASN